MKNRFLLSSFVLLTLLIINEPTLATQTSRWIPTFMVSDGGITHTSQNQTLRLDNTPEPGLNNRYIGKSQLYGAALFGFALERGLCISFHGIRPRLGAEFDYLRNNAVKGTVHPMVNVAPDFDQLNYTYDIQTFLLQATGKLVRKLTSDIDGYVQAGIGAAGNRLSNYREYSPKNSSASPMLSPFHNNTIFNPTGSLGLGFIFTLTRSASFSFGYRYIYTGNAKFDKSNVEQTHDAISLSPITYQFLVIGLSL